MCVCVCVCVSALDFASNASSAILPGLDHAAMDNKFGCESFADKAVRAVARSHITLKQHEQVQVSGGGCCCTWVSQKLLSQVRFLRLPERSLSARISHVAPALRLSLSAIHHRQANEYIEETLATRLPG